MARFGKGVAGYCGLRRNARKGSGIKQIKVNKGLRGQQGHPLSLTLVHNIRDCPSGAVAHSSFPLVQGEGWDGVLLYALIVKTE